MAITGSTKAAVTAAIKKNTGAKDKVLTKDQAIKATGVTTKAKIGNKVSAVSVARTGAVGSGDFQCVARFECSISKGWIDHFDLDIEWYSIARRQWVQLNNNVVSLSPTSSASGFYTYTFSAPNDLDCSSIRFRVKPVSGSRSKNYTYYVAEKKTSGSGKNKKTWWRAVKKTGTVTKDYFSGADWSKWSNQITGPAVQDAADAAAKLKAAVPDKPSRPSASLLSNNAIEVAFDAIDASVAANARVVYRCVDGRYTQAGSDMSGLITQAGTARFVDSRTAPGHEYRYYLRSVNTRSSKWDSGVSLPADLCDPVCTPPVEAEGLQASCYGEDGARVTFSYPGYFPALSDAKVYYSDDKSVLLANKTSCPSVDVYRGSSSMAAIVTGLEGGKTWHFAVWLKTGDSRQCELFCTAVASCMVASTPDPPTLLSVPRAAYVDGSVELEWVHNNIDGSAQTAAKVQVTATRPDGSTFTDSYAATTSERLTIPFPASRYSDSSVVAMKVCTKGAGPKYGDWSEDASLTVYARPSSLVEVNGAEEGDSGVQVVSKLPLSLRLSVSASTGALTQKVVQWRLVFSTADMLEYQDAFGNDAFAVAGTTLTDIAIDSYDDGFAQPVQDYQIAATEAVFVNGARYRVRVEALMDSGLYADPFEAEFAFAYEGGMPAPTATVLPTFNWGARISPSVVEPREVADGEDYVIDGGLLRLRPLASGGRYTIKVSFIDDGGDQRALSFAWDGLEDAVDVSEMDGWASVSGVSRTGGGSSVRLSGQAYPYEKPVENVLLSVYRIGRDGRLGVVAEDLPNDVGVFVEDMHPTFGEMTYRIVANDQETDEITVADVSADNDWDSILIQWNEEERAYTGFDDQDNDADVAFPFDFVELPWNIGVRTSSSKDVAYKHWAGRRHPVILFGTQVGETGSWSCEIVKFDEDWELGQLRKLAGHMGECWVREPSGLSYPANVDVTIDRLYDSNGISVTLEVTRGDD